MTEDGDVTQALRKYSMLKDRADELGELSRQLAQDVQDLRSQIRRLTQDLSDRRQLRGRYDSAVRRDRSAEARVEASLNARKADLERKEACKEEVSGQLQALRQLVERCEEFLTSNGASIDELQANMALPQTATSIPVRG